MISTSLAHFTKTLALAFYTQARGARAPDRAPHDCEYQLLAIVLAAVWIASEHGVCDPSERRVGLPPMVSRERFLAMVASAYDDWHKIRPPATLVALDGGRSHRRV
jgi:hypothetical protein